MVEEGDKIREGVMRVKGVGGSFKKRLVGGVVLDVCLFFYSSWLLNKFLFFFLRHIIITEGKLFLYSDTSTKNLKTTVELRRNHCQLVLRGTEHAGAFGIVTKEEVSKKK